MKLKLLISVLPLFLLFQDGIIDGRYKNQKHDAVYGAEISQNGSQIKFYVKKDENGPDDMTQYATGTIVKVNQKYYIENIKSPFLSEPKTDKLEMKIKGGVLEFKSYRLMSNLYDQIIVYSKNIKFEREVQK
ncbi:hypothetical protein [Flavobacterium sp. 3HN19-14]|uniref:hypothetical protein n=1 Tax=Flavobacterium sp. 3HN19-14 TaxID=3448133 RepID=UPI003EE3E8B2